MEPIIMSKMDKKVLDFLKALFDKTNKVEDSLKNSNLTKLVIDHSLNSHLPATLFKSGIIINVTGSRKYPEYHWNTIDPNLHMAKKLVAVHKIYMREKYPRKKEINNSFKPMILPEKIPDWLILNNLVHWIICVQNKNFKIFSFDNSFDSFGKGKSSAIEDSVIKLKTALNLLKEGKYNIEAYDEYNSKSTMHKIEFEIIGTENISFND